MQPYDPKDFEKKKPKIKILSLPSWFPERGNFFLEQATAIAQEDIHVDVLAVITLNIRHHKFRYLFPKYFNHHHPNVHVIHSYYRKIPKNEKLNIKYWVKKVIRHYLKYENTYGKPDIIHAHSTIWAGYAASIIREQYGVPFIITEHRSRFVNHPKAKSIFLKSFYAPKIKKALQLSQRIILVSSALKNSLSSFYPPSASKMITIPNMTDTCFFTLPIKERNQHPFTFFSLGVLEYVKGMNLLIKAFKKFNDHVQSNSFLIIGGKGSMYNTLLNQVKKENLENNVFFTGSLNKYEVNKHMHQSNVFVLPSRFEAFGVVFIEALSTGLPVIGTKSGGPEYIIHSSNGILAENEDVDSLQNAMEKVYHSYEKYDPVNIRKEAINHYDKRSVANQIIKIYKESLSDKNSINR